MKKARPTGGARSRDKKRTARREELLYGMGRLVTRQRLIAKLLNPELTMGQTELLLDVSKSTIHRLTRDEALKCHRTSGGQRRFRLLDVMAYMEISSQDNLLDFLVKDDRDVQELAERLKAIEHTL